MRAPGRRRGAILPTLVVVAVLVVAFALFTNVWTSRPWYRSFDFGSVFSTMLLTRTGLFLVFGLVMAGLVAANAAIAYRLRPRFRPQGPTSPLLERYREIVETRFIWVMVAIGVVVGLFAGAAASGQSLTFLAWSERTGFGVRDPQYGLDVSFFVFSYPWWRFVLSFAFAALTISVLAAAVMHYVMGAVRFSGPRRGGSTAAQAHLSILVGLTLLVRGASYWFDQYGLEVTKTTPLFTGISYTADNATANAKLILAIAAGIVALLFLGNALLQRWVVPTAGLVLLILSAIVLGYVYPGAVQYFSVRPSEELRERTYIQRNIDATRAAYDVADSEVTDYSATQTATAGQLRSDAEALPGIRLIDPSAVSPTYEQLQQVRGYYQFPKILDVDRYTIDGQETDAVVAVREMNLDGVEGKNWNNLKTVYTHGFGLVSAYGNRAQATGEPQWITEGIPPTGKIAEHEPRVYFGELQGLNPSEYSIVGAPAGAPPIELDTPGGPNYTYTGKGGVSIGSLWHKLLYAAKFADINILLSDRVNEASKIIYDRTPRERVQQAAPWLKVDGDAYPAVVQGRIVWIVDGYTTSNSYPNSERINLAQTTADSQTATPGTQVVAQPGQEINYMRNSVKAVVDAYDGTVKLYAWDESDPVLQTWRKVFGSVIQPKSAIPADLLAHLRYPQDYFKVQRQILARYHQTDPGTWYRQSSLWEIPRDPVNAASTGSVEQPFYLSVKWPGDPNAIFSLTTAYVPNGRSNLAAYMAVNADASSPDYGRIRILQMSDTTQIDGPGQSFNAMTTNESVSAALRNFTAQGSAQASFGNLLTLPLGGGLLYAMPVYAQRPGATGSYPVLRFVVVRFGQSVGFGTSLQAALDQVFSGNAGATTEEGEGSDPGTGTPGKADNPAAVAALDDASKAYSDAQKALTAGNLGEYQTKINQMQEDLVKAQRALGR
ncbi:UPF0182 family membrane protein [Microlunatus flavus]|uniref:UPF0182 family membrane protein n=1 Tax=Microlunatus flavus TaxID=1036181 RepID=UPI001E34FEDB|nr:UPF0182 family protein [Microlunatus flavus]